MTSRDSSALASRLLLSIAVAALSATALLPTVQAGANVLRRDLLYGPASPDFSLGYLEDRDTQDTTAAAAATTITANRPAAAWIRYARRGIDFPFFVKTASSNDAPTFPSSSSGASNGRNLVELVLPADRTSLERFVKRNMDEIDRTAFDNFFKRNMDEIDRVGWDGFVKRFSQGNYLSAGGAWPSRSESHG